MTAQLDNRIGRTVGDKYKIEEHLGEGATATVYRASPLEGGPDVALKIIKTPGYQTAEERQHRIERFKREALAISRLKHQNTVRLLDFDVMPGGLSYMVLELLEGQSWAEHLKDRSRIDLPRIADIGRQVCLALAEAHMQGVIHRDLKPENIFLAGGGPRDHVKVVDFGSAALAPTLVDKKLTEMGATVGSAPYMSPEQARATDLTPATDIYSLGVTLYESLAGELPFKGSFVELMAQHNLEPPPRLTLGRVPKHILEGWQALLDRMLAKEPSERPMPTEVAAELERLGEASALALRTEDMPAVPTGGDGDDKVGVYDPSMPDDEPAGERGGRGSNALTIVLWLLALGAVGFAVWFALR